MANKPNPNIDLVELKGLRKCGTGHGWADIGEYFQQTPEACRGVWRRRGRKFKYDGPIYCPLCGGDTEERAEWDEQGNYAEALAKSTDALTLEEFKAILRVDEDVWLTQDWGSKRWQVGAKIKEGKLSWLEGKLSGQLEYRGLGKENLWSTWARFIRREPVPVYPVVQPVECPLMHKQRSLHREGDVRGALLIADPQFGFRRNLRSGKLTPFHDRAVLDLALQVAEIMKPSTVLFLGDLLDMTPFTDKFVREPEFYWTTQPAILEAHYILRRLRTILPNADIGILEGNHDARMRLMLQRHLAEACDLRAADEIELPPAMSPQRLLALHRLDIAWVGEYPDGEVWVGPLRAEHGARVSGSPGGTAKAVAEDVDQHTAFGHVHRIERVSRRVRTQKGWRTVRAFCPGCACHTDGRVPGSKPGNNWQQGLAWVDYTAWDFTETLVEITEGRMVFDRHQWVADSYTEELREAWPDWNW